MVIAVGALLVALWYYSDSQKIKRALRNAALFSIEDFPDGTQGKVAGDLVLSDRELVAPLSGRLCAYYCIKVEEYRSHGKSGSWYDIINEEDSVDFVLDDGTGRAIVMVAGAKTAITTDHESNSGTFDNPTRTERNYLESHGKEGQGWVFNKKLRYTEAILEPGERVSVFGYGSKEPDPDAAPSGYREMQPMRLRISGNVDYPPMISDCPSVH